MPENWQKEIINIKKINKAYKEGKLNDQDENGYTLLHKIIVSSKDGEITPELRKLCELQADPTIRDSQTNMTALQFAYYNKKFALAAYLGDYQGKSYKGKVYENDTVAMQLAQLTENAVIDRNISSPGN